MSKYIEQISVPIYLSSGIPDAPMEEVSITVFIHPHNVFNVSHTKTQGDNNRITSTGNGIVWTSDKDSKVGLEDVVLHTVNDNVKRAYYGSEIVARALHNFGYLKGRQVNASILEHRRLRSAKYAAERAEETKQELANLVQEVGTEALIDVLRPLYKNGLTVPAVEITVVDDEEMAEINASSAPKRKRKTRAKPAKLIELVPVETFGPWELGQAVRSKVTGFSGYIEGLSVNKATNELHTILVGDHATQVSMNPVDVEHVLNAKQKAAAKKAPAKAKKPSAKAKKQ